MIYLGSTCVKNIELNGLTGLKYPGDGRIWDNFCKGLYINIDDFPDYCKTVFLNYIKSFNLTLEELDELLHHYPIYQEEIDKRKKIVLDTLLIANPTIKEVQSYRSFIDDKFDTCLDERTKELIRVIPTIKEVQSYRSFIDDKFDTCLDERTKELIRVIPTIKEVQSYRSFIDDKFDTCLDERTKELTKEMEKLQATRESKKQKDIKEKLLDLILSELKTMHLCKPCVLKRIIPPDKNTYSKLLDTVRKCKECGLYLERLWFPKYKKWLSSKSYSIDGNTH